MSLDSSRRTPGSGRGSSADLWPKWMWVAVPVLVVVVVAGLWWAIFSPGEPKVTPTPSPTPRVLRPPATQAPTLQATLAPEETPLAEATATRPVVIVYTFTPTAQAVTTPTEGPTASTGLAIGAKARVTGTGGSGLNMRAGAGTGHARIKTLPEGAIVEIIGGPKDANTYTWWQVKDESGTTGWVVSKFLVQQ